MKLLALISLTIIVLGILLISCYNVGFIVGYQAATSECYDEVIYEPENKIQI